jgi:TetR/AcrR family transcriptional regulator, transcriptional repressor for nem operon
MSQRERQKAASRQAIVESAAGLIRQRGPGGTSVQAAMAGAGLTVGAFYAHFEDKTALLDEAFAAAMEQGLGMVDGAAAGCAGADAIGAVLDRYLSQEHRDDPTRGCPLPSVLGEHAVQQDAAPPGAIIVGVEAMQDRLAQLGCPRQDALALVALMVGGQVLARALRGTALSDDVLHACREAGGRIAAPVQALPPAPGSDTGQGRR